MALLAGGARIAGTAILCCGFEADGDVVFWNAKIGGGVSAYGGTFSNPDNFAFDALGSEIDGNVLFMAFPPFPGPEINGLIDFSAATLTGGATLVIDGAHFRGAKGEMHGLSTFSAVIPSLVWTNNVLENGTSLNLRDTQVQHLYDDVKSWPEPGALTVDGFVYGDFGAAKTRWTFAAPATPPTDAATRLKWLALQPPGFHSQPYRQLAKVLAQRGDDAGSQQVLIAMEDARYATAGPIQRIYGEFLKATIGYGHRPLLTIFWSLAVVVLGWPVVAVAKRAGVMRQTWPENSPNPANQSYEPLHPFLYSLDVFLPFVNLHQERYWWPDVQVSGTAMVLGRAIRWRGSLMRYFLWYQIVAGWVLSAILLAGVTGLIRHD
jgi:hypothetical protein